MVCTEKIPDGRMVPERVGQGLMHHLPGPRPPTFADVEKRHARVDTAFRKLGLDPEVIYLPVASAFCSPVCDVLDEELRPIYRDEDHLSETGAIEILLANSGRAVWSVPGHQARGTGKAGAEP